MKITIPNIKRRSEVNETIQSQASGQKYSDLETAFVDKNASGDITINLGATAIIEAVRNIIITNFKEIPYAPKAGANITALLFSSGIKDIELYTASIKSQIQLNDNRVTVREIKVMQNSDDHSADVSITVDVKGDDRYKNLQDHFRIRRTANT